ncbi:MAG: hypothetical protein CL396_09965 [Acidiferrobacteraceae bacterium]|nr:hypothetical protein [Acidiferrobacteraceae bacterium]
MSVQCVAFDCDGVLVDAVSSWRTLHDHFGTDATEMLSRFIAREIDDEEFMRHDIQLWKAVQAQIHRDELFRAFSGIRLMDGAREVVEELRRRGVLVVIISAGIDMFVSSIAGMLKVDDWIANGFNFDSEGMLLDDGVMRVSAHDKASVIQRVLEMHELSAENVVSVGDSDVDLSMWLEGSRFIGFNPSRETSSLAFSEAGVPIVESRDLRDIWVHLYGEEFHPKE